MELLIIILLVCAGFGSWLLYNRVSERRRRIRVVRGYTIYYWAAVKTGMSAEEFAKRLGYKLDLPLKVTAMVFKGCANYENPMRMVLTMLIWNLFALQSRRIAMNESVTGMVINEIMSTSREEIRILKADYDHFDSDRWTRYLLPEAPPDYTFIVDDNSNKSV